MRVDLFQDRIYVLSPKGEIVDVPVGGTPLDFAYQVHTDLGHRTRGAKVNGRMVPLDYPLKNSETVEIITAKTPQPSRDWLSPQSGFLASPRHRNKVRAWFRKQNETQNKAEGRAHARARDAAPGREQPADAGIAARAQVAEHRGACTRRSGLGEVSAAQVAGAIQRLLHARAAPAAEPARAARAGAARARYRGPGHRRSALDLRALLQAGAARAHRRLHHRGPRRQHPRQSCANLARLSVKAPARVLAVAWGKLGAGEFPVDIEVQAFDRRGLVRDVSAALADEKISIRGMNTVTDKRDHMSPTCRSASRSPACRNCPGCSRASRSSRTSSARGAKNEQTPLLA